MTYSSILLTILFYYTFLIKEYLAQYNSAYNNNGGGRRDESHNSGGYSGVEYGNSNYGTTGAYGNSRNVYGSFDAGSANYRKPYGSYGTSNNGYMGQYDNQQQQPNYYSNYGNEINEMGSNINYPGYGGQIPILNGRGLNNAYGSQGQFNQGRFGREQFSQGQFGQGWLNQGAGNGYNNMPSSTYFGG